MQKEGTKLGKGHIEFQLLQKAANVLKKKQQTRKINSPNWCCHLHSLFPFAFLHCVSHLANFPI